ncbi:MAG: PIG-L family deacetylase, partial [Acidobacteriota bacterium]|nr:PIG-L family deacetylase [Acidobacteriota bacterium]
MRLPRLFFILVLAAVLGPANASLFAVSVHGAADRTGYNAGSAAIIRAVLTDAAGAGQYGVFASVRYAGSKSAASVQLHRQAAGEDRLVYVGSWPISPNASTGLYDIVLHVEDPAGRVVASSCAPGFFVYKKQVEITRVSLDKAFYAPGDRIRCEIGIKNLSSHSLDGLQVEFSNENYPWISTFSGNENGAGRMTVNPSLGLVVLRKSLDIPARGQVTLPMESAGVAAFLQGSQVALMGAGGPARHYKLPPPEIDRYTIAVWDAGRKNLLDMQFSPDVIVREPGRVLPKPYSRNYTHPYNDEIDFTKYREFYPPGYISTSISVDRSHTLYRPGDEVDIRASVKSAPGLPFPRTLSMTITDEAGSRVFSSQSRVIDNGQGGQAAMKWKSPADITAGVYRIEITSPGLPAIPPAHTEIAFNKLPSSLMVFCPHEDDEHPWAGLMRAMIEAGLPVHVVFYTGGDVGECERYYGGHPCDPVRAREFGTVRMEESVEALKHIGVKRDQISFLGLPDGGSGEIWFQHIPATDPFLDIYMAVDHAP